MTTVSRDAGRFAGGTGVVAAACAALCCAGAPIVLSVLSAAGLSWLRNDAILLPIIAVALGVALWGFRRGRRVHGASGPLVLGLLGSVVATIWHARLPVACDVR